MINVLCRCIDDSLSGVNGLVAACVSDAVCRSMRQCSLTDSDVIGPSDAVDDGIN